MIIFEGRSTYIGNYDVLYNSSKKVEELTRMYNNKIGRKNYDGRLSLIEV